MFGWIKAVEDMTCLTSVTFDSLRIEMTNKRVGEKKNANCPNNNNSR
jgi:hypothetical protein